MANLRIASNLVPSIGYFVNWLIEPPIKSFLSNLDKDYLQECKSKICSTTIYGYNPIIILAPALCSAINDTLYEKNQLDSVMYSTGAAVPLMD